MKEGIYAGFGKAKIRLPKELFPIEKFYGVQDDLHVRVAYIHGNIAYVIVSIELTSLREYEMKVLKKIVQTYLSVEAQYVLLCVTHTFSAPHLRSLEALQKDANLYKKNEMLAHAIEEALQQACEQVKKTVQQVQIGYGIGYCDCNVNRDMPTPFGYWLGKNEAGISDKQVPVLQFTSLDGITLAYLYSYDAQPSIMEHGDEFVSGDLYGASSSYIEQHSQAIALYCLGAAGDQMPKEKACAMVVENGQLIEKKDAEKGRRYLKLYGEQLGKSVLQTKITKDSASMMYDSLITLSCRGQQRIEDIHSMQPVLTYTYIETKQHTTSFVCICFHDIAIVAMKPELCSSTAMQIKQASPFALTFVITMVDGGDKYMPDATSYDNFTYEARNSHYYKGSAEQARDEIIHQLYNMKDRIERREKR